MTDRFSFDAAFASDATIDYPQWANRKRARFLDAVIDLRDYASSNNELALIFGFDVPFQNFDARVLVYTDAGLLHDQTLAYGDKHVIADLKVD